MKILKDFPIKAGELILCLTLVALINTGTVITSALAEQSDMPFYLPLLWELTGAYTILPLLPLLFLFARKYPFTRGHRLKYLPLHILASVVYSSLHSTGMYISRNIIYHWLDWGAYDYGVLVYRYLMEWHKDILVYWFFIGLLALYDYVRANKERELQSALVEARLQRARLDALKNQLDPHFLFNTLNTISATMYEDVRAADKMISNLSRLLRLSLDQSDQQETPLCEELRFLNLYLSIMKARFRDKLNVNCEIDPELHGAMVPNLLLQPVVENAIKHNQPEGDKVTEIRVWARLENSRLHLFVEDNGPGMGGNPKEFVGKGVGLSNTLARLEQLYGEHHQVSFVNRDEGGLTVHLVFPYKEETHRTHKQMAEARL